MKTPQVAIMKKTFEANESYIFKPKLRNEWKRFFMFVQIVVQFT